MDIVLLVASAAFAGPLLLVSPWTMAFGFAATAWLALQSPRFAAKEAAPMRGLALVGLLFLVVSLLSALRAHFALRAAQAQLDSMATFAVRPARCALRGTVVRSPTLRRGVVRVVVDVARAECDGVLASDFRVALTTEAFASATATALSRGDEIEGIAQLAPPDRFWNPELGDPRPRLARSAIVRTGAALGLEVHEHGRGPASWIDRARAHVRHRIDATYTRAAAPMARALVLGESDLEDEDDLAFRASGLSHLLAVSGMHLVLVVLTLERLLAKLLVMVERWSAAFDVNKVSAGVAIVLAWLYADFAGGSGSAIRAAWMLTVVLTAKAGGRRSTGVRALAVSTFAATLVDPLVVFDVSFALSLAATGGLLAFSDPLTRFFWPPAPADFEATATSATATATAGGKAAADAKGGAASRIAQSLATTLAATLPCAPLVAQLGPTLPLGGLFANVVAVPLGEIAALPLCLLHTLAGPIPSVEHGCAAAASGALLAVREIARACATTPWASLPIPPPTSVQTAAIAVVLLAFASRESSRKVRAWGLTVAALVITAAELHVRWAEAPHERLRVTMLDVAQGDALLVDLPNGEAMLIDGGGLVGSPVDIGARVVAPLLRARRRHHLSVVVLSHPHPDHYGGLLTGTAAVDVGAFWDSGQGEAEQNGSVGAVFRALVARGARVERPDTLCGGRNVGGAWVTVLAPCPRFDPDHGPNDNSLVLHVRFGRRSFLFVGDAEREEERRLLAEHAARLRADVLKVGHHGSATSTSSALLDAVRPAVALISTGTRNRFGHPRNETLDTLRQANAAIYRTDVVGQVQVETDGLGLWARTAVGGERILYTAAER